MSWMVWIVLGCVSLDLVMLAIIIVMNCRKSLDLDEDTEAIIVAFGFLILPIALVVIGWSPTLRATRWLHRHVMAGLSDAVRTLGQGICAVLYVCGLTISTGSMRDRWGNMWWMMDRP